MRAYEFTQELDEDWRKAAAGLGTAAALGLTSWYTNHQHQDPATAAQPQGIQIHAPQAKIEVPPQLVAQAKHLLSTPHASTLMQVAKQNGLHGVELAQFLSQCAHETLNFTKMQEVGSSKHLARYEPRYNPRMAHILGNKYRGDGAYFKGRGYLMITGRYIYGEAEKALNLPLLKKPNLAANPKVAAEIAVWYWKTRVRPKVNNFNDTAQVTRAINAGMAGLEDRQTKFQGIKTVLGLNNANQKNTAQSMASPYNLASAGNY